MTPAIKVQKLDPAAKLPHRAHADDSGADLFSLENHVIPPHAPGKVRTGIAISLPEGTSGLVWGKSSVETLGVKTMAGLIDAGYRGEVIVCLYNLTDRPFEITAGRKIAQLVVVPTLYPAFEEGELDSSGRGTGGFGSTGTH